MIIIYHQEEKKGILPAKVFFEKGFDNVYLLTGGLEEFHSVFPDYIEGFNIPAPKPLGRRLTTVLITLDPKTQDRKKTIIQPRQPTFTKEKPPAKITTESIYGKNP